MGQLRHVVTTIDKSIAIYVNADESMEISDTISQIEKKFGREVCALGLTDFVLSDEQRDKTRKEVVSLLVSEVVVFRWMDLCVMFLDCVLLTINQRRKK